MTVWQAVAPSPERRGFLPIATTPGDRLFIGLLVSAYIHLAWIGLTTASLWIALAVSRGLDGRCHALGLTEDRERLETVAWCFRPSHAATLGREAGSDQKAEENGRKPMIDTARKRRLRSSASQCAALAAVMFVAGQRA